MNSFNLKQNRTRKAFIFAFRRMDTIKELVEKLQMGDVRALARCITVVENDLPGFEDLLASLTFSKSTPILGFTGPPGAGKSTLINALVNHLSAQNLKIGIVAIDPTSPFNFGSLLGDRVRMADHFLNDNIYIRSLATRGSLGGLSAKIIEVTDVMKAFGFDFIIVETVGVGQSEVEIVGLADTTVLVLVPEAGDEVQSLKSGIMEIADIFVVNKSDRPGAELFLKNLHELTHSADADKWIPKIIKVIATEKVGVDALFEAIKLHLAQLKHSAKALLYTEKAYQIIQSRRMKNLNKQLLTQFIETKFTQTEFNLYRIVNEFEKTISTP